MAFIDDCLAAERDEQQDIIRQEHYERFLDGKTDAAFGRMPEYKDQAYLEGYLAGVKELPADPETKRIQHYSPHQYFAFGHIDGAERFYSCDEF
ncbi:hypothetical protein [Scytonema sp. PRP1]|uniref:hypothetical protein n=1 Tax=Scytonema sp. PRP1 TaxID=3120513 RepID=UPI00300C46C9